MKYRVAIHLHGSLRKIHPDPVVVYAETAHEALELATSQLPGFQPTAQGYKHVRVADFPSLADLMRSLKDDTELHVFPQVNGGKNAGFTQILVGAAMIGLAFVTAGGSLAAMGGVLSAAAAGGASFGTMMVSTLFMMGVSTVIGGVVSLLMPQPTMSSGNQVEASKYLGVPQQTTEIGTPIRVIYGLRRVAFHILSFNTNARSYTPS